MQEIPILGKQHDIKAKSIFGSLIIEGPKNKIYESLSEIKEIQKWFSSDIEQISSNTFIVSGSNPNNWKKMELLISTKLKNTIIWECKQNNIKIEIKFLILESLISIEMNCKPLNMNNFLNDWIYFFYRLKYFNEQKLEQIPQIHYSSGIEKNISLTIEISSKPSKIYSILTEKHYMNQIFSKYPECQLDIHNYNWGWIDEGPSNLIMFKENELFIHDFIVDYNPIGYIQWKFQNQEKQKTTKLLFTHKDLPLDDEVNPIDAFHSFRNGWLYYLVKIKDLAENSKLSIKFPNEILD